MSISTELSRLQTARNKIRTKLIALGLVTATAKLDDCASAVDGISNQGAVSATVQEGDTYTIPAGYHNGSGTVSGVAGGGNYKLQSKTVSPTKAQQAVTPDSLLSFAELSESFDSVTASCSFFKFKLVRRAHHFFGEGANHVLCSSAQYLRRTVYGFTVFLRRYFSRADSHASPDLVVDTGPVLSDVLGEFFLARRNAESSFKLSNGREYCRGRRIRSEIQRAVGKSLSRHGYSRVQRFYADSDVRIRLRVLQADVVLGGVLLYKTVFESESFHFRVAGDESEVMHRRRHLCGLLVMRTVKILRYPVSERA